MFIQIRNGQPFEHPIFGDNFRQAFPHIDVNNLPPEFARFERVQCPNNASTFQVDELTYQWVDNVVKDVWTVRPMTDEEKAAVHQQVIDAWALIPNAFNFTAWVLDEATLRMVPPIPRPVEEGKIFRWSGADNNWKEAPARTEGKYVFDFTEWAWVSA